MTASRQLRRIQNTHIVIHKPVFYMHRAQPICALHFVLELYGSLFCVIYAFLVSHRRRLPANDMTETFINYMLFPVCKFCVFFRSRLSESCEHREPPYRIGNTLRLF